MDEWGGGGLARCGQSCEMDPHLPIGVVPKKRCVKHDNIREFVNMTIYKGICKHDNIREFVDLQTKLTSIGLIVR